MAAQSAKQQGARGGKKPLLWTVSYEPSSQVACAEVIRRLATALERVSTDPGPSLSEERNAQEGINRDWA